MNSKILSLLTIYIALSILSSSLQIENLSNEKCSKFTCGDLATGCAVQKDTQSYTISKTNKCSETQYCPYLSSVFQKENPVAVNCAERKTSSRVFPGGECTKTDDCIYGTCTNNKCVGKKEGEKCTEGKNYECEIGLFCSFVNEGKTEAVCRPQEATYECNDDYECPNTHGCAYIGKDSEEAGKCVRYFSIDDGNKAPINKDFSFCKSSFAAENQDKNIICRSVKLKKPDTVPFLECKNDEECVYEYKDGTDTKTTSFLGTCDCGYNADGKGYCRPGNLDIPEYESYVTNVKNLLSETRCHTEERNNCHFSSVHTDFKYTQIENLKVSSIKKHLFAGNSADQECLKSTLFPNYNPGLVMPRCPKFEVKPEKTGEVVTNCAESNGYLEKDNYKVVISKCADNGTCEIKNSLFDKKSDVVACKSSKKALALPGEACSVAEDCENVIIEGVTKRDCVTNTCLGVEVTKTCTAHSDCKTGTYCKADTKTCQNQITDDKTACNSSYDCVNERICLKNKCTAAFTVELGEDISTVEDSLKQVACKSGFHYNSVCAEKRYSKDETKKVEKGLIKCQYMELCSYDITYGTSTTAPKARIISEYCTCGVNDKGDGYCPYSIHDYWTKRQKKVNDIYLKAIKSSGVHTVNRMRVSAKDDALCLNFYQNVAYANTDTKFYNTMFNNPTCEKADADSSDSGSSDKPTPSSSSASSASTGSGSRFIKVSGVIAVIAFMLFN